MRTEREYLCAENLPLPRETGREYLCVENLPIPQVSVEIT
jgi:hypothetical protein